MRMIVGWAAPGGAGRARAAGGAVIGTLLALFVVAGSTAAAAASNALTGPHVLGWGFSGPNGVSSDGTHVWVADGEGSPLDEGGLVTELNASTGALVQVISGSGYAFEGPAGISSDGKDVWVTNYLDGSVTGFPA